MKITDATHLIKRIKSELAEDESNVELLHRVHVNLASEMMEFILKMLFVKIPTY